MVYPNQKKKKKRESSIGTIQRYAGENQLREAEFSAVVPLVTLFFFSPGAE